MLVEQDSATQATARAGHTLSSPAGLQAMRDLKRRRTLVLTLNLVTWLALIAWAARLLSVGSWTAADAAMLVLFAFGTPWSVLGFWNALIGLVQRHGPGGNLKAVVPFLEAADRIVPLRAKTAVLMTLRNEDPARALLRLQTVKASLDATGEGAPFSYFVLSDTDRADIAAAEEAAVGAWRQREGADAARICYRRRQDNSGYKAGNLRDFCTRWGDAFEFMLPLDADSLMTGPAITRLQRIMEAYPKLGIVQSLVVGTPSASAFARIFQFGMRHGMRAYTMGQAWWVGDCGPFWGHNGMVRIAPFVQHCELPVLAGAPPLGGPILSHDQVEAVLMRRAGYEVRVMPVEGGSYEDNPPDALEFARRDVRWCQGNMQYVKLLNLDGLQPTSRFQLVWAILMFIGVPAWTLMIVLMPWIASDAQTIAAFPVGEAKALYVTVLLMFLAPKLAGLLDAALTPGEVRRFGGPLRFTAGAALEIVFSFLLGAITALRTSIFMAGLLAGRSIVWGGQQRDAKGVSLAEAARGLWPHLLFGLVIGAALYSVSPQLLLWSLPLTAGYVLAIPFTVLTAAPAVGRALQRWGLAGIPEDFAPPLEIRALQQGRGA